MKKLSILLFVILALTGCATMKATTPPAGCENSLLWKSAVNPSLTSGIALIATTEALVRYPQAKPMVAEAIAQVMILLNNEQASYADLSLLVAYYVKQINVTYGARLVVYSTLFIDLDQPLLVDKCDRDMIRTHLKRQLSLL